MCIYPQFDFDFDLFFSDILDFCVTYKIDFFDFDSYMQKVFIRKMLKKIAHGSHVKF